MDYAVILCEDCNKEYKKNIKFVSEVFDVQCDFCKSNNVYILEVKITNGDNHPIELGNGGCGARCK
jgi:hypothetical protein